MRDELIAAVQRLNSLDDLDDQTIAVGELLRDLQAVRPLVTAIRTRIVRAQRERGRANKDLAAMLQLHEGTVSQIAAGKQTGRKRPAHTAEQH